MPEKSVGPVQTSNQIMRRRALMLIAAALGWAVGFWAFQHQWIADYVAELTTYHGMTQENAMEYVLAESGLWWHVGIVVFLLILSACYFLRAAGLDQMEEERELEENAKTTGDGLRVG